MGFFSIGSKPPLTEDQQNLQKLTSYKDSLQNTDLTKLTDEQITGFVQDFPGRADVYAHYGKQVYSDSSFIWRGLTYMPGFSKATGFDTYAKLGKKTSLEDMSKFRVFLKEDITKELEHLSTRIAGVQRAIERHKNEG